MAANNAQAAVVFPLPERGAARTSCSILLPHDQKHRVICHQQMQAARRPAAADGDLTAHGLTAQVTQIAACAGEEYGLWTSEPLPITMEQLCRRIRGDESGNED